MVGCDAGRAEPAAGDLDRGGMVAQEVVVRACRGDDRTQLGLGLGGRLAEAHAIASVGGDPVEHGRCPLPALDDADDRRVRQPHHRHQRIGLGVVPTRLVGLERPAEHEQLVECRDTFPPLRGVSCPPGDGQPEGDRAGVRDDDVEVRGLGDDRHVTGNAGADRGQRPLPAVLFGRHEGDDQLTSQPIQVTGRPERPDRGQDRRHAALHVACAAAIQRSVPDLRAPRIGRPGRRVAGRDDIEVPRQHEPPPARPAGATDHDRERGPRHLLAGPVRVRADRLERRRQDLDGQPELTQHVRGPGHHGLLRTGDARDPDERRQIRDEPVTVDSGRPGISHGGSAGSCRSARPSR